MQIADCIQLPLHQLLPPPRLAASLTAAPRPPWQCLNYHFLTWTLMESRIRSLGDLTVIFHSLLAYWMPLFPLLVCLRQRQLLSTSSPYLNTFWKSVLSRQYFGIFSGYSQFRVLFRGGLIILWEHVLEVAESVDKDFWSLLESINFNSTWSQLFGRSVLRKEWKQELFFAEFSNLPLSIIQTFIFSLIASRPWLPAQSRWMNELSEPAESQVSFEHFMLKQQGILPKLLFFPF